MKLYCGISFHGYGHLAQTAPVINELAKRVKLSTLTLQSAAPTWLLQQWFWPPFQHLCLATDLGIPMINALKVDQAQTWLQYEEQHRNKARYLSETRQLIAAAKPDLVLSNNSHLLSRAAAELGIPCFHFCSLNWADNFLAFCQDQPEAKQIYQALCDDYNQANAFFRLPPHMPMPGFNNLIDVGPICRVGSKIDLQRHFQHQNRKRYILVSMGGMPYPIHFESWPDDDAIYFINGGAAVTPKANLINQANTGLSMLDLITSVDVIITKPGYGTYMEAACSGTPILYLPRGDWPEEPYLNAWQKRHAISEEISAVQLQNGNLGDPIAAIIEQQLNSPYPRVVPDGVDRLLQEVLAQVGY